MESYNNYGCDCRKVCDMHFSTNLQYTIVALSIQHSANNYIYALNNASFNYPYSQLLGIFSGMVYWNCVKSAMLHGSETWCLKENENFEKDQDSNGESNVRCKTDGEKEDRGPNGDVRIEGNSGSDGKGEWSEMEWACVEEG